MFQPISRQMHAVADFSFVPLVASAPDVVNFRGEAMAVRLCHLLSGLTLLSCLITRAEWAPIRLIPYRVHLVLDTAIGLLSLVAPWIFGFANHKRARNTFLAMGVAGVSVGLLSRPEELP